MTTKNAAMVVMSQLRSIHTLKFLQGDVSIYISDYDPDQVAESSIDQRYIYEDCFNYSCVQVVQKLLLPKAKVFSGDGEEDFISETEVRASFDTHTRHYDMILIEECLDTIDEYPGQREKLHGSHLNRQF